LFETALSLKTSAQTAVLNFELNGRLYTVRPVASGQCVGRIFKIVRSR